MAAQDAKPSPSDKEVGQQQERQQPLVAMAGLKAAPSSPQAATTTITIVPSYEASEASQFYVVAKSLLSSGEFEQALELIVAGIEDAKAVMTSLGATDEEVDLHDCLAPFHYLYGTTLLYSIEESNDTQMTVGGGGGGEGGMIEVTHGGDNDADNDKAAPAAVAAPVAAAASAPDSEAEPAPTNTNTSTSTSTNTVSEEHMEDMEIAWENLDTARNIVEGMLRKMEDEDDHNNNNNNKEQKHDNDNDHKHTEKVQLDLAQILLREGDLQRMNGRYSEAILDYDACLQWRQRLLDPFDRKIADAQYNLGLSYLSSSSELQKQEAEAGTTATPEVMATKRKAGQDHCQKGVDLYVDCARTLCGQLAALCAVDASRILDAAPIAATATVTATATATATSTPPTAMAMAAGMKTTGMEEAAVSTSTASQTLRAWRQAVATTLTPIDSDDPRFHDLVELLDEIQETIDEAHKSQQAVREATQLKVQAQQAILTTNNNNNNDTTPTATTNVDGSTTQIGFGPSTTGADVDVNPWANLSATAGTGTKSAAGAAPMMMVVKKKKKRDDTVVPATASATIDEAPEAKRPKTE